jgi:hypothetical protein
MRCADGSMSWNSSTHLPCISDIINDTPVMFPPGRAKLATRPVPTASPAEMTMGTSRVACCAACAEGVDRPL